MRIHTQVRPQLGAQLCQEWAVLLWGPCAPSLLIHKEGMIRAGAHDTLSAHGISPQLLLLVVVGATAVNHDEE